MKGPNTYTIPIAIVVAGILIAGALFFVNRGNSNNTTATAPTENTAEQSQDVPALSASDHVLGNPNAQIVIVEYSDTECPFCKQFHTTMHRVIDQYGRDGKVAWVYRHFPIAQLHSKAPKEAEATECAAELGGNDGFWAYVDRVFEVTPSNNGLSSSQLPNIAEEVGLDRAAFTACLNSGKYTDKVDQQFNEAIAAGARGTPFNVIIAAGQQVPIEGAQPFSAMRAAIDSILSPTSNPTHQGVPVINP